MKFAVLGFDADALELAAAVAASQQHTLSSACEVGGAEDQLRAIAPRVQFVEFWESLLASDTADAVIVAVVPMRTCARTVAQACAGGRAADPLASGR